ncbi:hypothetical protein [Deinococcus sp. 6GRE01]|uniref:hypothetical protein n=1 Tax=Deinococcus sp. 6GRE01 TaxID=2745873 RepID=UPI001E3C7777|nr:hypothetical protein [Deinococcus sp. 6GRE01]MCD0157911.1 hypothetical protein [Deinococcus sp. 6GRE01]
MRIFNMAALLTTILALSTANAAGSTSTGFGSATSTMTASGTYASAVSFTIPDTTLTIPKAQVRPGATFTVTIPVTNTTDRAITIEAGEITNGNTGLTIIAGANCDTVAPGGLCNLEYTLTFANDSAGAAALGGTDVSVTFAINAFDTAAPAEDLTVGSN